MSEPWRDPLRCYPPTLPLEQLGAAPLSAELARIAALSDKKQLPALIARNNQTGAAAPIDLGIHQDNKDSTKYVVDFVQSGLGLPDRDYYLKKDDAKLADTLAKYEQHIAKMLTLAGDKDGAAKAKAIVALETELAKIQWSKVELRDPVKAYNKVEIAKLGELTPGYDWNAYLDALKITGKVNYVIVSQPTYLKGFNDVLAATPLDTWKAYFQWHAVRANAAYLSKAFVDENFAFYGTVLSGAKEQRPRWKRGVVAVEGALGEAVGKVYVEQHFPAERKARMEALVKNLLVSYKQSIDKLDWMSPATKKQAQAKLAKFTTKIGYPNKWRDYSALEVKRDDLVGNVQRSRQADYNKEINKLGKPIDRDEWGMTPQTVNAYYNPEMNEIVFPAAILQPPFFDANADDAVNYGGIGAVIGHEISHGFDDQGAQYDGDAVIILIDVSKVKLREDGGVDLLIQTKRHSTIAHLLQIEHVVVAVNKMDLVNYDQAIYDRIVKAYQEFAQSLGLKDITPIPLSALSGDNVVDAGENMPWYQGPTLSELLESLSVYDESHNAPFRFPVQLVARHNGHEANDFRGYMGRIEAGNVKVGDKLVVSLSNGYTDVAGNQGSSAVS
eukprot:gene23281-26353_t